jgi:hypothetical protein
VSFTQFDGSALLPGGCCHLATYLETNLFYTQTALLSVTCTIHGIRVIFGKMTVVDLVKKFFLILLKITD